VKDQHFLDWLAEEGMDELDTTHQRDDRKATEGEQDWGAERQGPPETKHAAE
jgi:NADH-quinone oxidoreductase subunit I